MKNAGYIAPIIVGSGRAAKAIERSLAILNISSKEFKIADPIYLKRNEPLEEGFKNADTPNKVLIIANPPGLHAELLREGARLGFPLMIVEKPACVSIEEIVTLKVIATPVAVCHVYRQTWGIQKIKQMIRDGELGDIITIEGRYWQSSTAQRAIGETKGGGWKNDPTLSGPSDAMLDVGVHWLDTILFLSDQKPMIVKTWRSYANSESPHRDSHVQIAVDFDGGGRAFGSISKTAHGSPNQFEVNVIGTKASATWKFLNSDQIEFGQGSQLKMIYRRETSMGSEQGPFHGVGWLEGYVEIFRQCFRELNDQAFIPYPTLTEHLNMLNLLLRSV